MFALTLPTLTHMVGLLLGRLPLFVVMTQFFQILSDDFGTTVHRFSHFEFPCAVTVGS